ncbi:MAG: Flp family type IVb pilin [Hyphomicrobiaceae bacterium]|nr:Flp family type IVb pilin [Hyphomicrobiaceae bacterium]
MKKSTGAEGSTFGASRMLARFAQNECGATAIEYALIAGGLSITIIIAVYALGDSVGDMYTGIAGSI